MTILSGRILRIRC